MNSFKSYYVVWKHARGERMYENPIKFKSYYVVWKLFLCKKDTERDTGV